MECADSKPRWTGFALRHRPRLRMVTRYSCCLTEALTPSRPRCRRYLPRPLYTIT